MLKVDVIHTKGKYTLTMTGHCDTAPKGYDLVCAAASILCLTMAQILEENGKCLKEKPLVDINDGEAKLVWKPKPMYEASIRNCFYTVATGLKVLQHNHPDCIEYNEPKEKK